MLCRFPSWEELYQKDTIERLPWYWPALDPDLEAALAGHGIASGRILDQGTGPGTPAIALGERGFTVTATDVSAAAVVYAARKAKERRVQVNFVADDVLASALTGPFDAIVDRAGSTSSPPSGAPSTSRPCTGGSHRRGGCWSRRSATTSLERRGPIVSRPRISAAPSRAASSSSRSSTPSTKGGSIRTRAAVGAGLGREGREDVSAVRLALRGHP